MKWISLIALLFFPLWVLGGTTVIEVRTEGWGTITKKSGETNPNGAMVWNGRQWMVNNTWAHMYFLDTRTGLRIKTPDSIQVSREGAGILDTLGFQITRRLYSYSHLANNKGSYQYTGMEYTVANKSTGKQIVLRSKGTGNGIDHSYFDICIQNEDTTGLPQSFSVFRNDPLWFTYSGITLEQAVSQTDTVQNLTGKLNGITKGTLTQSGRFFLDIGGGGDLGPAGVGKSYIFRTDSLPGTNIAGINHHYAVDFTLRFMDDSGNLKEFRFLPKLTSEKYMPAAGTAAVNKEPEWVRFYGSGLYPPNDQPNDMVVDITGNIYVTGSSEGSPYSADYMTIKYDPLGTVLWSTRYNNGGNDVPRAIAVDAAGNVYVTGMSFHSETYYDLVTIKYNTAGQQLWLARYNGPGNLWDDGKDISVDSSGNVYVTGKSEGAGTDYDFVTIKYNASGLEQWVKRYNGTAGRYDGAEAMVADPQGNIFVVGYTQTSETTFEFLTIKYNSQGEEQWLKKTSLAVNSMNNPVSTAVDPSGNLVVAGTKTGAGLYNDCLTIKYDPLGNELWMKNYNGPAANSIDGIYGMTIDPAGIIYVTGYSQGTGTGYDLTTIKYSTSGSELWVKRYSSPGSGSDYGSDVKMDVYGNIVVSGYCENQGTGYDYATIKYKADGTELWVKRYNHTADSYEESSVVVSDASGNILVTGYSRDAATGLDFATVKYSPEGTELWVKRYNGTGNSQDLARAIAADKLGNVYVTGSSDRYGSGQDYVTIKYDPQGELKWLSKYNGSANSLDQATAIAVDTTGNVYVTGSSSDGNGNDYTTIKYNPSGVEQWVKRYNGPGNGFDDAKAIAVDQAGNVYVTGMSTGTSLRYDYATIKYSSDGAEQWVKRYNGPGNVDDQAYDIEVDNSGNVFVTGSSGGSGTRNDYATIKYNKDGTELWVKRYNGPSSSYDNATALALDGSGNVFVTGNSPGSGTFDDYATVKYNKDGVEQWVKRYNGPANSYDVGMGLVADKSGNIVVTGSSNGTGSGYDYTTIKYNTEGTELWVKRYNGPRTDNDDQVEAIALDDSSNVYVTGKSQTPDKRAVIPVTIKYGSDGTEKWVARFNKADCFYGFDSGIAVGGSNSVYVSSSVLNDNISYSIYTTLKYTQSTQGNPFLMVSPDTPEIVSSAGGTVTLTVSSNTTWNAADNQPWMQVSQATGSGNGSLVLNLESNPWATQRTASVTFSATGVPDRIVTVTQAAATAVFQVSVTSLTIGHSAGSTASFTVTSNTAWTINTGQGWLSANPSSGTGNATIVLTAQANTFPNNRMATVTVSAAGATPQSIQVTQSINTAVTATKLERLQVYPNPFKDKITVRGINTRAVLKFCDLTGRVLLNRVLMEDATISTHSLPAGMYIMKMVTGDGSTELKLVKK